jgi:purine-nucleoside/S-methyl-5'-thioadenosine phosphorylase / adenosine deaminase
VIASPLLARVRGAGHAHSTRADGAVGPLRLPGAAANRAALVRAAGGDPEALCVPEQVHGARVAVVDRAGTSWPGTDALVTSVRGAPLLVQGADCPLIALADEDGRAVAVVHSGWRGTVARIAADAVASLAELGSGPSRLAAAVFPGIGPCCFEVGPEVGAAFESAFGGAARAWVAPRAGTDRSMLDLRAAIVETLAASGVARDRIDLPAGCTACGGTLWSHRASRGGPERHGLVVVVR